MPLVWILLKKEMYALGLAFFRLSCFSFQNNKFPDIIYAWKLKNHVEWLLSCVRPMCDNLDDATRGASSSTPKSEEEIFPPVLLLPLLFGVNISDDFFSNFQSCDNQYGDHDR